MIRPSASTLAVVVLVGTFCPGVVRAQVKIPAIEPVGHDIRPGPGVTATRKLSDYLPVLAHTPGDSDVYVLQGREPGATVFVAGGTHANEIAGIMAATLLVERAQVRQGRLIVLPHANNSAITWSDPLRPGPESFTVRTPSGERRFRFGSRYTKPAHQGAPDPAKYHHPGSTEMLDGAEARNLDRAHPGRADGTLTERISYAIVQLIRTEDVEIAFDLHEAGPESRLAWMIVANPKNIEAAAIAVLSLEAAGVTMKLEPSSDTFRGLSHREWGDATRAKSFLFETPSPSMVTAARTVDPVDDPKFPLARRVAVHLASIAAVLDGCAQDAAPSKPFKMIDVPGLDETTKAGVGAFLK